MECCCTTKVKLHVHSSFLAVQEAITNALVNSLELQASEKKKSYQTYFLLNFQFGNHLKNMDAKMNGVEQYRPTPKLNQRIISSMSRRSVAAHPWHDLEIGTNFTSLCHLIFLFPIQLKWLMLFEQDPMHLKFLTVYVLIYFSFAPIKANLLFLLL